MKLQFENEQLQETLENIENEKAALERELSKLKKMIKEKYPYLAETGIDTDAKTIVF